MKTYRIEKNKTYFGSLLVVGQIARAPGLVQFQNTLDWKVAAAIFSNNKLLKFDGRYDNRYDFRYEFDERT